MAILSMLEATAAGEDIATLIRSYAEVLNDLVEEEISTNEARSKLAKVGELVYAGMTTDGDHHKQWYLAEIAKAIGMVIGEEVDEGAPP